VFALPGRRLDPEKFLPTRLRNWPHEPSLNNR
jgi:hypothetical protein